jgi:hypothetical protein
VSASQRMEPVAAAASTHEKRSPTDGEGNDAKRSCGENEATGGKGGEEMVCIRVTTLIHDDYGCKDVKVMRVPAAWVDGMDATKGPIALMKILKARQFKKDEKADLLGSLANDPALQNLVAKLQQRSSDPADIFDLPACITTMAEKELTRRTSVLSFFDEESKLEREEREAAHTRLRRAKSAENRRKLWDEYDQVSIRAQERRNQLLEKCRQQIKEELHAAAKERPAEFLEKFDQHFDGLVCTKILPAGAKAALDPVPPVKLDLVLAIVFQ